MTLQAYKNDTVLKAKFLKEIEKHRKADAIVQGSYGDKDSDTKHFRGCAVGCSVYSLNTIEGKHYSTNDHSVYETSLGIPEWLARLEDTIFEGLPKEEAKKWPGEFAKAIHVGANLEPVKWKFSVYLMKENIDRVLALKDISDELKTQVVNAIRSVLVLNEEAIQTGKWDESAAESAAESARSAAYQKHAKELLRLLKAEK